MFGLDNKSGINAMPPIAPADSQTPKWFTEGGAGLPATYPGQDWFNQIQAELLNVLNDAGITPQKDVLNQLSLSIKTIVKSTFPDVYTKTESDVRFQPKGSYQAAGYSYSKAESDNRHQLKGNYLNKDSAAVQVVSGEIQSRGLVGSIFDDKNLNFLTGRNGLPVWGSYDGTNFHYVNHPKKSGTAALTSDLFGIEQEWYDLKNERSAGVNYKNNTSKPICLFVRLGSSQYQTTEIKVGGKTVGMWTSAGSSGTTSQGAFAVIPPGATYAAIANQGSSNILDWTELR